MKNIYLTMKCAVSAAVIMLLCNACACCHKSGTAALGRTPQMGWNSWNKFQGRVSEQLIRETADAMATNGMKAAGYQYVNIDDFWQAPQRDAQGNILSDPKRFPSGIKPLADYVHSKGLKLGVYSDAGGHTCGGRPGSRDHEAQDAQAYASWGVDYLKYDWCDVGDLQGPAAYKKMSDALRATGRPIFFSLCEWGTSKPWTWARGVGQSWRTTGDIYASFDKIRPHKGYNEYSVLAILDLQDGLRQYAGPGGWNDPDMLEVGNGMLPNEDRAHFTLWCFLDAPLITGNDLRHMNPETLKILTDKDLIAINQDRLGIEALKYSLQDGVEIFFKPLTHGAWAMCILNRNTEPRQVTFDWKKEKVTDDISKRETKFDATNYQVRNLWTKQDMGTTETPLTAEVAGHDVLAVRLDK
ncbi:MAG: glycoside hydrolase family 27 protein [Verrucomicrobiota bacterium]